MSNNNYNKDKAQLLSNLMRCLGVLSNSAGRVHYLICHNLGITKNQDEALTNSITGMSDSLVEYIDFVEGEDTPPTLHIREGLCDLLGRGLLVAANSSLLLHTLKDRLSKKEHVEDGLLLYILSILVWTTVEDNATVSYLAEELKKNIIWNT